MGGQIGFHYSVGLDAASATSQDGGARVRLKDLDHGKRTACLLAWFVAGSFRQSIALIPVVQCTLGDRCGEGTPRRSPARILVHRVSGADRSPSTAWKGTGTHRQIQ